MTHSLQTYASALRAMGWTVSVTEDNTLYVPSLFLVWDDEYPDNGVLESAVRSAVLKIAPGSFACPWFRSEHGSVVVYLRTEKGYDATYASSQVYADTYPEAWLNAAVALVEAGMVPS